MKWLLKRRFSYPDAVVMCTAALLADDGYYWSGVITILVGCFVIVMLESWEEAR